VEIEVEVKSENAKHMEPVLSREREERVKILQERCRVLQDCTEPGSPPWTNDLRLASHWRGFTGYPSSTPIPTWDEGRKLRYWRRMQALASAKLRSAIGKSIHVEKSAKSRGANGSCSLPVLERLLQTPNEWVDYGELRKTLPPGSFALREGLWVVIKTIRNFYGVSVICETPCVRSRYRLLDAEHAQRVYQERVALLGTNKRQHQKKPRQLDLILSALRSARSRGGRLSLSEIKDMGIVNQSARIKELRSQGFGIKSDIVRGPKGTLQSEYRLIFDPFLDKGESIQ
jgi:Helix-turn-helix domain